MNLFKEEGLSNSHDVGCRGPFSFGRADYSGFAGEQGRLLAQLESHSWVWPVSTVAVQGV